MKLVTPATRLKLTDKRIDLQGKKSLTVPEANLAKVLGPEELGFLVSAKQLLGIATDEPTYQIYTDRDGVLALGLPKVGKGSEGVSIYWGLNIYSMPKGVTASLAPEGKNGFCLVFTGPDEDLEPVELGLVVDIEALPEDKDTWFSLLNRELNSKKGDLNKFLKTPGANFIKMSDVEGMTLKIVEIKDPNADKFKKIGMMVDLDDQIQLLQGNTSSDRILYDVWNAGMAGNFSPETPGYVTVTRGEDTKEGKAVFKCSFDMPETEDDVFCPF
jgi:hypothetical protein